MQLHFFKYQGSGNDFILVDHMRQRPCIDYTPAQVQALCQSRWGVGADGLIVLLPHATCDLEMVYYNADGSTSFCANGTRCAAHLAHTLGYIASTGVIYSYDGPHAVHVQHDSVTIDILPPSSYQDMPQGVFVNTGSPHYVHFLDSTDTLAGYDVLGQGKAWYTQPIFPVATTNVNFAAMATEGSLWVRTYERGVGKETLSCGSGVVASALAASCVYACAFPLQVHTLGGVLHVQAQRSPQGTWEAIQLQGPAVSVFQGTLELPLSQPRSTWALYV